MATKSKSTKTFIAHEIKVMKLAALKDHPQNPRTIRDASLKGLISSVEEFGLVQPIIWNKRTGHIVGGHQRRKALLAAGYDKAQVLVVDFDKQKEIGAMLTLNNEAIQGEYTDGAYNLAYEYEDLYPDKARALMLHDLKLDLAPDIAGDENQEPPIFSPEKIIETAFQFYRHHRGFPYQKVATHLAMQQINRLAAFGSEAAIRTNLAYHVADTYHPHRYEGYVAGKKSMLEYFSDDNWLRIAIKTEYEMRGAIGDDWFSFLGMTHGSQTLQNFRPGFAMYLYRKYGKPGGVIVDPCTGYGGRLVGWFASRLGGKYIGVDPSMKTTAGNLKMANELGMSGVHLIQKPFEDSARDFAPFFESVDFAFTSPPYFSKERYSEEDTQSWVRYKTIDEWQNGFLLPMMRLVKLCLKKDARFALNITDVDIGSKTMPLEDMTVKAAKVAGFKLEETLQFELPSRPGANTETIEATEPVFIFKK